MTGTNVLTCRFFNVKYSEIFDHWKMGQSKPEMPLFPTEPSNDADRPTAGARSPLEPGIETPGLDAVAAYVRAMSRAERASPSSPLVTRSISRQRG